MRRKMLVVSDSPNCAAVARAQLAQVLAEWGCREELAADAVLVASELVTNAMLHGRGCTSLAAVFDSSSLRLEVGDRDLLPPQQHRYDDRAATGWGLCLVEALSAAWGWEPQAAGKIVWAEMGVQSKREPEGAALAVATPRSHAPDEALVRFRQVPVAGYLAMQEQNDAIHRDVDLVLIGWEEGLPSGIPEDLLRLVQECRNGTAPPASSHRAAVEEAASEGRATVDLEEWLPRSSVSSSYEYVRLLERIEAYAGEGELLVGRPADDIVRLRRWFVDEVVARFDGTTPAWGS